MPRSAFTLLEMILVLLVIVIVAGLFAPYVDSMMHPAQVTAAIDMVRANWEQTRARAMEEGRPYRFSIVENGNAFRIEPDDADINDEVGLVVDDVLPESCLFVAPGGSDVIDEGVSVGESGGMMKAVLVFLPDGTARADAEISFGRPGMQKVTLRLRALTGAISQVKLGESQ